MLRKLLMLVLLPPLLICAAVLVMIGLKDLDLLVAIVSKLMVVAIIGIPVMLIRMTILPGRSPERPFRNVVPGFSLVPRDPKGSHYRTVGVRHLPDTRQ